MGIWFLEEACERQEVAYVLCFDVEKISEIVDRYIQYICCQKWRSARRK